MAYAPHTNEHVRDELRAGIVPTARPLVLGGIWNHDAPGVFEYAERRWTTDDFAPEMPHIIYVGPGQEPRLAKVLKTVAYVVTDESADGTPVIEKWKLHRHDTYNTQWVRA